MKIAKKYSRLDHKRDLARTLQQAQDTCDFFNVCGQPVLCVNTVSLRTQSNLCLKPSSAPYQSVILVKLFNSSETSQCPYYLGLLTLNKNMCQRSQHSAWHSENNRWCLLLCYVVVSEFCKRIHSVTNCQAVLQGCPGLWPSWYSCPSQRLHM